MRFDNVENLTAHEKNDLIRFFLHFMGQDQRGQLMVEKPIVYIKLFPTARAAVIERVSAAVTAEAV